MIGIYKITNHLGQIYVGSSNDIYRRWNFHMSKIRKGKLKVHKSIEKYGLESHKFEVLEECEYKILAIKERFWQDKLNSYSENNLNVQKANNCIYFNGKRKRTILKEPKNFFLDLETGIYYKSVREISNIFSIKYSTLKANITRNKVNKTKFIDCNKF